MRIELPILKDGALNARLASEGYVILPLLDAAQVARLRASYYAHHLEDPTRFYASAHVHDTGFRLKMSGLIREVACPAAEAWLEEGEVLGGSFIAKPGGQQGILPPHADWNIVDERSSRSFNLWIPLVDTRPENGAVHILPGSHLWFDSYRGPGIPNPFQGIMEEVWRHMVPLNMKAGEALLYDHRLVHASPANQSAELRLACVSGLIRKGTAMRYYCMQDGKVQGYESNVAFFLEGDPAAGPGGLQAVAEGGMPSPPIDKALLEKWLGLGPAHVETKSSKGFWSRLLGRS